MSAVFVVEESGRSNRCYKNMRVQLILVLLVLIIPVTIYAETPAAKHRQILLLNSYHQNMTWVKGIVQAVESELDPVKNNILLHIEQMDTKRHFSTSYLDALYRLYKTKYENIKFDLILTSDNNAFDFIRQHRDELFPGVPVVFCGVNSFRDEQIASLDGFTGVVEFFDAAATLQIALQNHPKTRQVFIVNDYLKTGRAAESTIRRQLEPFASRVEITYSDNVSIDELGQHLAGLDKDSLVLLGSYFADRDDQYVTYEQMGKLLAHFSTVPVYCVFDFNVGEGVIGGSVIGGTFQGEAMAKIALRILQGESPGKIPVQKRGGNRYVFDAQELNRFEIDIANLPEDSIIANQAPDLFQVSMATFYGFNGFLALVTLFSFSLYLALNKRKKTEAAHRENEAKIRTLLNSTAQAILGVDKDGNCSFCNLSAIQLLGCEDETELIGQKVHQFVHRAESGEDPVATYECGICQVCRKNSTLHLNDTTLWRFDRTPFPAELWALPITIGNKVEGGVVSFIDISDRLEEQKQNIRMAQLASLGEISASIAHEINNPLCGIINYTQILLNKNKMVDGQFQLLERIIKESERVATIVRNMLRSSRDSGGVMALERLEAVLLDSLSILEHLTKRTTATLSIEIQDNLPDIYCNKQQIEQVLVNILKNALHALIENDSNERIIDIAVKQITKKQQSFVQLIIANNGPNIPEELVGQVLKPFVTTKPEGTGTGLGLSISSDIMKRHGGSLEVSSVVGAMTSMILMFPLKEALGD